MRLTGADGDKFERGDEFIDAHGRINRVVLNLGPLILVKFVDRWSA